MLQPVKQLRAHKAVFSWHDQLYRYVGVAQARFEQAADKVGAVQLDPVYTVGALAAADRDIAQAFDFAQQARPGAIQAQTPAQLGQQWQMEEGDVPGTEQLPARLQPGAQAALAQAGFAATRDEQGWSIGPAPATEKPEAGDE